MTQVSSSVSGFDFDSQNGVMSVLASIRASNLSAPEKNELRDLVFLYKNGGGDVSVKIALEQKLATHQIAPVAVKAVSVAPIKGPDLEFGSYRPTPSFKMPAAPTMKPVAPVTVPAPVISATPPVVETAPTPAPVAQSVPTPKPVTPPVAIPVPVTPEVVAPAPVVPATPAPQPVSTPAPVDVVVPATPIPVAVTPEVVVPVASVPVAATSAPEVNYLERIRQIKTAVNSKVGNPVNLVDINNAVGREYMNALLEAMKKLSSGAVSEMGPIMARLETAYAAVEVAIKNYDGAAKANTVNPVVTNTPVASPMTPAPVAPEPNYIIQSAPVAEPMVPVVTPIEPLPVRPLPEPEVVNEVPTPSLSDNFRSREPETVPESLELPVRAPLPNTPIKEVAEGVANSASAQNSGDEKSGFADSSLASTERLKTPLDLPDPASLETSEDKDPLFTTEVDNGLNQLLSDWVLFKKSGIFGSGPKGIEHPLFKKIAELQVPILLAGRFEGATQEIRQSITDYMNGWRYEQGIIYQPGETFERYLRRVIRHILDLQKRRHKA